MSYAIYVTRTLADKSVFGARSWEGLDADEARETFERYVSEEREVIGTIVHGLPVASAKIELRDYGPHSLPHPIGGRVIRKATV